MSGVWPSSTWSLKTLGDLFLGHVNGRHHHVRRRLLGELNDPLAQVGLADLDARLLQVGIQMDFFRGHRLRFDDALDAVFLRQVEDVVAHLRGIGGAKDVGTACLGISREGFGQLIQMRGGITFALGNLSAHGFEIDAFVSFLAADAVGLGKTAQCAREFGIVHRGVDGVAKFFAHQFASASSSTKTMMSFSGPCTPMVSTRSMSAVRLGPVMNEM